MKSRKRFSSEKTENSSKSKKEDQEFGRGTLTSMLFSLFLVGLSLLFVVGFHHFLKNEQIRNGNRNSDDILTLDQSFKARYIIIKNSSEQDLFETEKPGEVREDSRKLEDGELLLVRNKGEYEGKMYYRLKNKTFVEARPSQAQEVVEYIPLEGYIAITYISSSGVHIRSWVDFEADNVIRTVFVGDRVDVEGMVVTTDGRSAFRTSDGYYITTDSSYFSDYTNLKDKVNSNSEEDSEDTAEEGSTLP